ncbi:MAG TPA: SRPBCC domain-containing protein [Thermoplasmata archaeon]|nr:SRPBCC domain-containing protein [Thermoplasmata archaeon]
MSGLPGAQTSTPPPVPRSVLLADAKVTIRAPIPRVFEALLDPAQLVQWWADDPRVEAELGGRYEGTLSDGRIEGSITAIDGPGQLSFMWPIPQEGGSVETSVAYELAPKGPETFVHLVHRSPKPLAGGWTDFWNAALESLRAFLESSAPVSE